MIRHSFDICTLRRGQERCARIDWHSGRIYLRRGSKQRNEPLFPGGLGLFAFRIRLALSVSRAKTAVGRIQSP
jgi:hypothetical protein